MSNSTTIVRKYDDAYLLAGTASARLAAASAEAAPTGAVNAYCEDGVWYYVPESSVDFQRRSQGRTILTVYVESVDRGQLADRIAAKHGCVIETSGNGRPYLGLLAINRGQDLDGNVDRCRDELEANGISTAGWVF